MIVRYIYDINSYHLYTLKVLKIFNWLEYTNITLA